MNLHPREQWYYYSVPYSRKFQFCNTHSRRPWSLSLLFASTEGGSLWPCNTPRTDPGPAHPKPGNEGSCGRICNREWMGRRLLMMLWKCWDHNSYVGRMNLQQCCACILTFLYITSSFITILYKLIMYVSQWFGMIVFVVEASTTDRTNCSFGCSACMRIRKQAVASTCTTQYGLCWSDFF